MKNEKYRLQVSKSSLQAFAKAVEHMLQGGKTVGNKALIEFEKIDPSSDMAEFVRTNRQPFKLMKVIVPAFHGNDSLEEVMKEYLETASLAASENVDKTFRRLSSSTSSPVSHSNNEIVPSEKILASDLAEEVNEFTLAPRSAEVDTVSAGNDHEGFRMDRDEELFEAQPLGVSDFEKKFKVCVNCWIDDIICLTRIFCEIKLNTPDQVVESYTCALYFSNFPYHGRLYLTRDRMCFSGWRDTVFVR